MKIVNVVIGGCITLGMLACNNNKEEPVATVIDKEQIKKEIQAREDEFAEVYNSGKIKSIGYYAEDAITFFQNQPPIVGREAILEFLRSDMDSNTNKILFTTNEVFPSNDGNQVVEVGSFKVLDSSRLLLNSGNYMVLFEKRNGKYVCVRDISVSDMPH